MKTDDGDLFVVGNLSRGSYLEALDTQKKSISTAI